MCRIMGLPQEEVHHIRHASQNGLEPIDTDSIEIVGEKSEEVPFKLPMTIKRFSFLGRLVNRGYFGTISRRRLVLDKKLCKKCKICVVRMPNKGYANGGVPGNQ